jgi:hypothetical protein
MTEPIAVLTRHDLEAKIVKRCWEDEEFRRQFAADPAGAFVRYLEIPAANIPKIVVHQESPGSWHIVIPSRPANANQLSEADLERVAGGVTTPKFVASAAATAGLTGIVATAMVASEKTPDNGW